MIDPETAVILSAVPEFRGRYLTLVEEADGDPGGPVAFEELAQFAAELAVQIERSRPVLARVLAGVEEVARASPGTAEELVGWAFLDSLSPDDLARLVPWLGPATRRVLDELDLSLDEGEDEDEDEDEGERHGVVPAATGGDLRLMGVRWPGRAEGRP